ncbi:MAG: hypothetical protein WA091_02760 [Minisyncoccales bacterium]
MIGVFPPSSPSSATASENSEGVVTPPGISNPTTRMPLASRVENTGFDIFHTSRFTFNGDFVQHHQKVTLMMTPFMGSELTIFTNNQFAFHKARL